MMNETVAQANPYVRAAMAEPRLVEAEACKRSLFSFMQIFWHELVQDEPVWNWHIAYLANLIQAEIVRVGKGQMKTHDTVINIPPGTTKSLTTVVFGVAWSWLRWPWMRHICGSYSGDLAVDHAGYCKDLVDSEKFRYLFPHLRVRTDRDARSNFRIQFFDKDTGKWKQGGGRYATSVGGTVLGMHGHMNWVDDPLNPRQSVSETQIATANDWIDKTLSTRKVDKSITPTILIMQRLHQDDPSGHTIDKDKPVRHIKLPGECINYEVKPAELKRYYVDGLLDSTRHSWDVLRGMEVDLGPNTYAGQVGQEPAPPSGNMFIVDGFKIVDAIPGKIIRTLRYWDKAGSVDKRSAYTCGVAMAMIDIGAKDYQGRPQYHYVVMDVARFREEAAARERKIKKVAQEDGKSVHKIYIEQEPGSGGKDSVRASIGNLAGFAAFADRPSGDKTQRADPWAGQVNAGHVMLLRGRWNEAYIEEHRFFPHSRYKDQVDASSGAFSKLTGGIRAGVW
jgi:predicted phage terminase large subunit-like protein